MSSPSSPDRGSPGSVAGEERPRGVALREPIFYGGESAYILQYRDFSLPKYATDNAWRGSRTQPIAAPLARLAFERPQRLSRSQRLPGTQRLAGKQRLPRTQRFKDRTREAPGCLAATFRALDDGHKRPFKGIDGARERHPPPTASPATCALGVRIAIHWLQGQRHLELWDWCSHCAPGL